MTTVGSVGKPAMYRDARIVDDAGQEVAPMERGEVVLRGRNLFGGYWRNDAATKQAVRNGWLHTGDLGYRDPSGRFHIVERKDYMFISGGENIYPAELEAILLEHPGIVEAAVVGVPDARWGAAPAAAIVKRGGSTLDADTVRRLFDGRLGRFKHPRDVVFLDALPRNALGKIVKATVREALRKT